MNDSKIRILLVDDHPIVREGLRSSLGAHERIEIIGEAADGLEAVHKAQALQPSIVLMDITMPVMNGLEATQALRKALPQTKVIALTMHDNKEYIMQLVEAGARGYVLKDSSPRELARIIELIHKDESFFISPISKSLLEHVQDTLKRPQGPDLTPREKEVLNLIAQGKFNKEIAADLALSIRTVETHRERIMRKLDLHTVAELTKYAIAQKIVNPSAALSSGEKLS